MAKPEDIVADGLSLVPVVGGILSRRARGLKLSDQAKLEDQMAQVHWDWLGGAIDALPERVARVLKESPRLAPTPADIGAVVEAALKASRKTADPRKRRALQNAVVNAFDPDLWSKGVTLRIIRLLEELEYPDLYLLQRLKTTGPVGRHGVRQLDVLNDDSGGSLAEHSTKLLTEIGLLWPEQVTEQRGHGTHTGPGIGVSMLGRLLLKHVREPTE